MGSLPHSHLRDKCYQCLKKTKCLAIARTTVCTPGSVCHCVRTVRPIVSLSSSQDSEPPLSSLRIHTDNGLGWIDQLSQYSGIVIHVVAIYGMRASKAPGWPYLPMR